MPLCPWRRLFASSDASGTGRVDVPGTRHMHGTAGLGGHRSPWWVGEAQPLLGVAVVAVEPGLIGGEVNRILAAHQKKGKHPVQYKIGPDPSSIDSCMIGGIVNNNSSGMCCGVSQVRPSTGTSRRAREWLWSGWRTAVRQTIACSAPLPRRSKTRHTRSRLTECAK